MTVAQKAKVGKGLIKKLCCPRTPTKKDPRKRWTVEDKPELHMQLWGYCAQDIEVESDISANLPELSPLELDVFQLDLAINTRGVQVDMQALGDCLHIVNQAKLKYTAELNAITGNPEITVDTLEKIKKWALTRSVTIHSMTEDAVADLLKQDLPPDVKRVLEIRQILGSAGVKKLYAIDRSVNNDGRVRGLYAYCGARQTGRFAGRGAQPQNMTASGPAVLECEACDWVYWAEHNQCPKCTADTSFAHSVDWGIKAAECALSEIATRDLQFVESRWGNAIKAVSGCLRSLFVAAPGKELICSDYTAIEAVVLACIAGEEWRINVFRTHGLIYEESASKISGIPFQEFIDHKERTGQHHPLRKKVGKVAELASGYQGWIGAWKNFGADKFMDDAEIKKNILAWRAESPMIVEMWGGQWRKHPTQWQFTPELYGLEGAAIMAILNPGTTYNYRRISYFVKKDTLYCRLPSGRCLVYHKPRLIPGENPLGFPIQRITFEGWNADSTKGPVGWMRRDTYGGKLTENATQAIARDIFIHGLLNVERAGYPIVLHTHDEPASEVPLGYGSIEEYERLMCIKEDWYKDWPIKAAGGWRGHRYHKD